MAYSGGGAFGGFPGGYNQTPGGIIPNAGVIPGAGVIPTLGANLPSVDPNNFAGTVHFGPSTTTMLAPGQQFVPGGGVFNPNAPGF